MRRRISTGNDNSFNKLSSTNLVP